MSMLRAVLRALLLLLSLRMGSQLETNDYRSVPAQGSACSGIHGFDFGSRIRCIVAGLVSSVSFTHYLALGILDYQPPQTSILYL